MTFANQIQDQPVTGNDKVYRFIAGLKPDLRRLCMVDPSRQNQIWAAEDFDRLVSYALNIEASFDMQPTAQLGSPNAKKQKVEQPSSSRVPNAGKVQPTQPIASSSGPSDQNRSSAYLPGWPRHLDKPNAEKRAAWKGKCWLCMSMGRPEHAAEKHLFSRCPHRDFSQKN